MRINLCAKWQVSSLTDPSLSQNELSLPNSISSAFPNSLTEEQVAQQEWHLSHEYFLDEKMLSYFAIDLVVGGVEQYAEIRVNGIAVLDCDGSESVYRKEVRSLLHLGKNRIEILFVEQDEDWLLDDNASSEPKVVENSHKVAQLGVFQAPYFQAIRNVRLENIKTEQVWHHGGGCELIVDVFYSTIRPGLISAAVKFDGMTYQVPLDVRDDHVKVIFQVEAPIYSDIHNPNPDDLYELIVVLDGQRRRLVIGLSDSLCVSHSATL